MQDLSFPSRDLTSTVEALSLNQGGTFLRNNMIWGKESFLGSLVPWTPVLSSSSVALGKVVKISGLGVSLPITGGPSLQGKNILKSLLKLGIESSLLAWKHVQEPWGRRAPVSLPGSLSLSSLL